MTPSTEHLVHEHVAERLAAAEAWRERRFADERPERHRPGPTATSYPADVCPLAPSDQEGNARMKYVMFVVGDPDHTEEDEAAAPDLEDWFAYVRGKGAYLSGVRLQPTEDATTVKVRGGELLVTDGPFTESKEWIAGFAMLECADLDEAIEIASRNPMAFHGRLELRPVHSMGGPDD